MKIKISYKWKKSLFHFSVCVYSVGILFLTTTSYRKLGFILAFASLAVGGLALWYASHKIAVGKAKPKTWPNFFYEIDKG